MKFFYTQGKWLPDRRKYYSIDHTSARQIDLIKSELPCSVAESFLLLGIFFDLEEETEHVLFWIKPYNELDFYLSLQKNIDDLKKEVYILVYDDDSPVIFRNLIIPFFESEIEVTKYRKSIMKKIDMLHSNVVLKSYLIKPD